MLDGSDNLEPLFPDQGRLLVPISSAEHSWARSLANQLIVLFNNWWADLARVLRRHRQAPGSNAHPRFSMQETKSHTTSASAVYSSASASTLSNSQIPPSASTPLPQAKSKKDPCGTRRVINRRSLKQYMSLWMAVETSISSTRTNKSKSMIYSHSVRPLIWEQAKSSTGSCHSTDRRRRCSQGLCRPCGTHRLCVANMAAVRFFR